MHMTPTMVDIGHEAGAMVQPTVKLGRELEVEVGHEMETVNAFAGPGNVPDASMRPRLFDP